MSAIIRLWNADRVVDLNDSAANVSIREGSDLGQFTIKRVVSSPWHRDFELPAGINYGNRMIGLHLKIKASSIDNFALNYDNIVSILSEADDYYNGDNPGEQGQAAYLDVQLNGASNLMRFDILGGTLDLSPFRNTMTFMSTRPTLLDVPLRLIAKPFGRQASLTHTVSSTLNNGGGTTATNDTYILPSAGGDFVTPCRFTFQPSSTTFLRFLCGKRKRNRVANFRFAFNVIPGVYSDYTVTDTGDPIAGHFSAKASAVVAAAHNADVYRWSYIGTTGTGTWEVQVQITKNLPDFYGRFKVYYRIDTGPAAAAAFTAYSKYGGASGTSIVNSSVTVPTGNNDILVDLGYINIPEGDVPVGAVGTSFYFRVGGTIQDATNRTIDGDCIYLVPVDEEVIDVTLNSVSSSGDQLVDDLLIPRPLLYFLNSSGDLILPTYTANVDTRFHLPPDGPTIWCPLITGAETSSGSRVWTGHDLTKQFTLTFDYTPLYGVMR